MGKAMNIIYHAIRGCRTLPHVGPHPGTPILGIFVALGIMAGARDSWQRAVVGGLVMFAIFGVLYLIGAYSRSVLSDRIALRRAHPPEGSSWT